MRSATEFEGQIACDMDTRANAGETVCVSMRTSVPAAEIVSVPCSQREARSLDSPRYLKQVETMYSMISNKATASAIGSDLQEPLTQPVAKATHVARQDHCTSRNPWSTDQHSPALCDTVDASTAERLPSTLSSALLVSSDAEKNLDRHLPRNQAVFGVHLMIILVTAIVISQMAVLCTQRSKRLRFLQPVLIHIGGSMVLRAWHLYREHRAASLAMLLTPAYAIRFRGAGFLWPYYMGAMKAIRPYLPQDQDHSPTSLAQSIYYQGSSAGSFAAIAAVCGPKYHELGLLLTWYHQRQAVQEDAAKGNEAAFHLLGYLHHGMVQSAEDSSYIGPGPPAKSNLADHAPKAPKHVIVDDQASTGGQAHSNQGADDALHTRDAVMMVQPSRQQTYRSFKRPQAKGHRPRALSAHLSALYNATPAPTWLAARQRVEELSRIMLPSRAIVMEMLKHIPLSHLNHRLCIVAWDCLSWQPVYRNTWTSKEQIWNWAVASCRIPFVTGMPMPLEGMLLCDAWGHDNRIPLPATKLSIRVAALCTSDEEAEIHPPPEHKFSVLDAATHLTPWREVLVQERGRLDANAYLKRQFDRRHSCSIPAVPPAAPSGWLNDQDDLGDPEVAVRTPHPNDYRTSGCSKELPGRQSAHKYRWSFKDEGIDAYATL